ncbi:MarR family winged helix-turn-helix transcriptional regulator [Jiella sp. M17.18]|uniref:MarR family winged helix-turn-helix transcriptional regulator n=1 Tax=Jiella sp. M17.18 TaxID=3234247 RepID=UPI0034DF414F
MPHESVPSLGFLLVDTARLLRRRFDQECRDLPMTSAQMQIIARISKNEGIGQSALAALLELEPMTVCRHVDRMVAADLVERRQDPADRRARQLFTTEKGRTLLEPMRALAASVLEEAQAGLSAETRATLFEALQTISRNLSAGEAAKMTKREDQRTVAAADEREPTGEIA